MTTELRDRLLKENPNLPILVQHFLDKHVPEYPIREPVVIPRDMFDSICLVALVGLEALEG